jgi:UDP-N-acetylglucosamine 2-epimerase (non-hydrolysing)
LKKIISVVGARPNFMKVAPLHKEFCKSPAIDHRIVHTGQHYDANMSKIFFEDLGLPQPDIYLGIGSGSHAVQTARIMIEFEQVIIREKPDLVIVVGDVNSTAACSFVCSKLGVKVAHVEAGLRSFDRTMPEEINRLVTDAIADYLFVSEPSGVENLKKEGVPEEKIFFTGNVMIDSLIAFLPKARTSVIHRDLSVQHNTYALVTLHRPSNVDRKESLEPLVGLLQQIAGKLPVVFPVHPRTRKMMEEHQLLSVLTESNHIRLCEPLGYLDFLALLASAKLVITDSGGIQEETTYLGIPCLTMRENTERPVTVTHGTNQLMGNDYGLVIKETEKIAKGDFKHGTIPELWDGNAAGRIVQRIIHLFSR